jgi:hypothetical protein
MRRIIVFVLLITAVASVTSQDNVKIRTQEPVYIDVNSAVAGQTHNIYDGIVSLEYTDHIGYQSEIALRIFDWKSQFLGTFKMDKSLGSNHYTFELKDLGIESKPGNIYRCEIIDENRTTFSWNIRDSQKPDDNKPMPTIQIKPIQVACGKSGKLNLAEFYGSFAGGRAPFTVNWYVLNEARTEFIYQPKEEKAEGNNLISMIRVDSDPVYNVLLLVTDACGNTGKQMIRVSCNQEGKKVNTFMVEPLTNFQTPVPIKGN